MKTPGDVESCSNIDCAPHHEERRDFVDGSKFTRGQARVRAVDATAKG